MYGTSAELYEEWGITPDETERFKLSKEVSGSSPMYTKTPEEAAGDLTRLGFQEDDFLRIVNEKIGGHDQRADAIIALGGVARIHYVLVENLRHCDYHDGVYQPWIMMKVPEEMAVEALKKRWDEGADSDAEVIA